jgi:hypothetical protein
MPKAEIPRAWIRDGSLPSVCIVCGNRAKSRIYPGVNSPSIAWVLFSPILGLLSFWVYTIVAAPSSSSDDGEGLPFANVTEDIGLAAGGSSYSVSLFLLLA